MKKSLNLSIVQGVITRNPELEETGQGKPRAVLSLKTLGTVERLLKITLYSALAEWATKEVEADGKKFTNVHQSCEVVITGEVDGRGGAIAHQVQVISPSWDYQVSTVKDFLRKKGYTIVEPIDGDSGDFVKELEAELNAKLDDEDNVELSDEAKAKMEAIDLGNI